MASPGSGNGTNKLKTTWEPNFKSMLKECKFPPIQNEKMKDYEMIIGEVVQLYCKLLGTK